MSVTIVIPAYNEAENIESVLRALADSLRKQNTQAMIIVVDDGSTDDTAKRAESVPGVRVLRQPYNKGYGAALKRGILAAETEWCITYDADGQHQPEHIAALLPSLTPDADLVVGKRDGYQGPRIRQPGKRLLKIVAEFLARRSIPDLNSGLRAFRREVFLRYCHLFPNGFSLSTTSTICFFHEGLTVKYVPINIKPRSSGRSTVKMKHATDTLILILRLIMLFDPLRIFLPASLFFGVLTVAELLFEWIVMHNTFSKSSVALISLTALTFFFGLLADQIAAMRREQR